MFDNVNRTRTDNLRRCTFNQ
ncbi:MAG: hypothetical protein RL069_164, partial [Planctomycetota bacterium]